MERRLNTKLELFLKTFKDGIRDKIIALNITQNDEINKLIEYIYDYNRITVDKEDFIKRKRVKNSIPENNRCMAKRANGEQCTRRRMVECDFCGTHSKGTPHGLMTNQPEVINRDRTIDVFAKEIKGIVYYIDNFKNVYNTEDILKNKKNPAIVAQYTVVDRDTISIPSFELI
jgi:hypothetical protein